MLLSRADLRGDGLNSPHSVSSSFRVPDELGEGCTPFSGTGEGLLIPSAAWLFLETPSPVPQRQVWHNALKGVNVSKGPPDLLDPGQ